MLGRWARGKGKSTSPARSDVTQRRGRELRCRLPEEKEQWIREWLGRGVAETSTDIVMLALEALHEKILQRNLAEARLRQLRENETP